MIRVFHQWMERYLADEEAVLVLVLLAASVLVLVTLGVTLAPMITAIIIAFLMQGLVLRLKSWGVSHIVAVSLAFFVLVSSIFICLLYVLPALWWQLGNLFKEAPKMLKDGQEMLLLLPEKYPSLFTEQQVTDLVNSLRADFAQLGQSVFEFSLAQLPVLMGILIYFVLVPILVFFFLKDSQSIIAWFTSMLPNRRPVMQKIWHEMNQQIANYVRGKVIEIFIVAFVSTISFALLGLNYALLLGFVVGLSVLIPYIGAAVATLPVALIAFFQWGWGSEFLYVMVVYAIIQALDGNVLVPLLFSEAVKMHPVAIILAVLVFGALWGFWGVFFAIPLATLCKAIINAWPTAENDEADAETV